MTLPLTVATSTLLTPWLPKWTTGWTAEFYLSVTSPLNTITLLKAGMSAGSAAPAAEVRKHGVSDGKAVILASCVFLLLLLLNPLNAKGIFLYMIFHAHDIVCTCVM